MRRVVGRAIPPLLPVLTLAALGCASPPPSDHHERVAEARRGLEHDPAVAARADAVEAAIAREQTVVPIDEFQVRVGDSNDGDNTLRLLARVPVPNPMELHADRAIRRAETETSLARLEETSLARKAENCAIAIAGDLHRERERLFAPYETWQQQLLEWGQDWHRSGVVDEMRATRFEIERRIATASRMPEPAPPGAPEDSQLPPVEAPPPGLEKSPDLVHELVRRRHPAASVAAARSKRFEAMGQRTETRALPWFDFVDLGYEVKQRRPNEIGGQVAVRVPLGPSPRAGAKRYRALSRAEQRDGDRALEEQVQLGRQALEEIEWFEINTGRWQQLLDLAQRADELAVRWQRSRINPPWDVATLVDRAYDARATVLEVRARAGLARCRLMASTGVAADDWPRQR
jgi:hypothetical protein